jgi:RNA-binding protein 39
MFDCCPDYCVPLLSSRFGYIEFYDPSAVVGALAMQGYELMGHAVMVKVSEAEKNVVNTTVTNPSGTTQGQGSTRLYIGNLNPKITEGDLKMVFSELGDVEKIELAKDPVTGAGRGYAYLKYKLAEDAKKALVQLNGVELASQKIKVGLVNENDDPTDKVEDTSLNAQSRAILMQKLQGGPAAGLPALPGAPAAAGTLPTAMPGVANAALQALMGQTPVAALAAPPGSAAAMPPSVSAALAPTTVAFPGIPAAPSEDETPSPCLLLMNLFDPAEETEPDFDEDIKEDVAEECNKYGRLEHVWVDKNSAGWVYMKFDGVDGSKRTYDNLNRRWFAKRMITAKFIPEHKYKEKFGV